MSNHEISRDDDLPRVDPWLGVTGSSFIPVAIALYLPPSFLIPLTVCSCLLFGAGMIMLRRQTRHRE
jgi:hypothetical protein